MSAHFVHGCDVIKLIRWWSHKWKTQRKTCAICFYSVTTATTTNTTTTTTWWWRQAKTHTRAHIQCTRKKISRFQTTIHPNDIFKLKHCVSDTCHCGCLCKILRARKSNIMGMAILLPCSSTVHNSVQFRSVQFIFGMNRVIYAVNYVNIYRKIFVYRPLISSFGKSKGKLFNLIVSNDIKRLFIIN